MDNFISARYGELQAGAAETTAGAGRRETALEEYNHSNLALGGDWDDPIYQTKMADNQHNYNMHMEDIASSQHSAVCLNDSAEEFHATQMRCMTGYR